MKVNHELEALKVQQAWTSAVMQLDEKDAVRILELVHEQLQRDIASYKAWLEGDWWWDEESDDGEEEDRPYVGGGRPVLESRPMNRGGRADSA